jgi:NAD(P) transhydrogenase subunit alpha
MLIAVPREIKSGEKRVALVPDIISKLTKAGLSVVIESNAGLASEYADEQFKAAGAQIKTGDVLAGSDVEDSSPSPGSCSASAKNVTKWSRSWPTLPALV